MAINRPGSASFTRLMPACALACAALLLPALAFAQGPELKLDQLDQLESRAKETVNVALDPKMLQMASGFLTGAKTASAENAKAVADMIAALKGVYVRSYEFEKEGLYTDQDVDSVRLQLKAPWSRMVNVRDNEKKELVEVYMWPDGAVSGGLAVLVAEPKELTIVNIVGRIDMAQLAALAGKFGIPQNFGLIPQGAPPAPR
jgi:hypothetical protein